MNILLVFLIFSTPLLSMESSLRIKPFFQNKMKKKNTKKFIECYSHVYMENTKIKKIMIPVGISLDDSRVARLKELFKYKNPLLMQDEELKEWVKNFFLDNKYTFRDSVRYSPSPLDIKFIHHDTVAKQSHSLFSKSNKLICLGESEDCNHTTSLSFKDLGSLLEHCSIKKRFSWICYICRSIFHNAQSVKHHIQERIPHHENYNALKTNPLKDRVADCVAELTPSSQEQEAQAGLLKLLEL